MSLLKVNKRRVKTSNKDSKPKKQPKPRSKPHPKPSEKFCANCRKGPVGIWMGGMTGMQYLCNNCGFISPIVLEKVERKKK